MTKNKKKNITMLAIGIMLLIGLIVCIPYQNIDYSKSETNVKTNAIAYNTDDYIYLSDIDYIAKQSSTAWGKILKDITSSNTKIQVKVDNGAYSFDKGMWAHASSTLVYDLSSYNYAYFTSYIGINTTSSKGNGVIFYIYTSNDGTNWELKKQFTKLPGANAEYVKIDIKGASYLKLVANDNGGNGNDHSVYADAKLIKEDYNDEAVDGVEVYDEKIKALGELDLTNESHELLLLQREFVKNAGKFTLKRFVNESQENRETFEWLFNNLENLKLYILGGKPSGSYYNSLDVLKKLLNAYKSDFDIKTTTKYGTVLGDLYKKMAITLSLTHSTRVSLWMHPDAPENISNAVTRYQIYKDLHKNGNLVLTDKIDISEWFEKYNIEEMRFVMNNSIDDEEILWLNEYTQKRVDAHQSNPWGYVTSHPYMAYVWPNYQNPIFYATENKPYFDELFDGIFSKYGVTYRNGLGKVWMNLRNKYGTGAVCGGISKTGTNMRGSHGIPAAVIGQPGHAAMIYYNRTADGKGYWSLDNDVSGWTLSEKGERMLNGWGNASYQKGYSVVYMILAQEALNDYENYTKSQELVMLANSYAGDNRKQEAVYRNATNVQSINIDAWYGLVNLYLNDKTKTEKDYFDLAKEIAEALKNFPLPMYHLTNLLKGKFTSVEYGFRFTLLQTRTLEYGSKTTTKEVLQPGVTRTEANYLLGKLDKQLASFSFDGQNANKIALADRFNGSGVRWDYSIDGKQNWKEVVFDAQDEHKWLLTNSEINAITETNDIYVHIVGTNYSDENIFKIDITKGTIPSTYFANDLENRVVGVSLAVEWRYSGEEKWTKYSVSSPDLTGNKTVEIRMAPTGTKLASDVVTYTFTEDNQPDTRKYIPVSHLSIHSVSTEATANQGHAKNAIDGNYNTRYHSAWNGTDTNRFMVIKLDKSVYLSAVEFVPAGGGNGKIYDGTIYGSMDGENWEELTSLKNLTYTNQATTVADAIKNTKSFEIENPKEVQYVKIVADRTNGNWFTARAFNLYQDITKNPHPTAGIAYSTTESTNGKVTARLVNSSTKITITNNNGSDTYIFNENGEFTFEFVDENGVSGSAVATVNWIDKDIPSADVKYDLDDNKKMSISLDGISEDVYLLDNNNKKINYIEVENGKVKSVSYLDSSNNVYKIVDVDENGCIVKITYKNTSDKVPSVATYVTIVKDGVVAGEEYYDNEGNSVEVTDDDKEVLKGLQQTISNPLEYTFEQSGSYEFKLLDKASNIAYKNIKADYVDDTIIASDITYDITSLTNKNVVATMKAYIFDEKGQMKTAQIINGETTHVFEENGEFTFQYKDDLDTDNDNVKEHTAIVSWIDKKAPTAQIVYSTKESTKDAVTATLKNPSEPITIINNGGKNTYTFTENGTFTFKIEDEAGNVGNIIAKVDWIQTEDKPNEGENKPDDNKPNTGDEKPNPDDNKPSSGEDKPNDYKPTNYVTMSGYLTIVQDVFPSNNTGNSNSASSGNNNQSYNQENWSQSPVNNQEPSQEVINNDEDTTKEEDAKDENEFEYYKAGNVTLKTPAKISEEKIVLKSKDITIPEEIKEKVTEQSEYFELYFETENNKVANIDSVPMTMTVKTDNTKKMVGVYEVKDNNRLVALNYQKLGSNQVELNVSQLGKYIIAYEPLDQKEQQETVTNNTLEVTEAKNNNIYWVIASGALILILLIAFIIKKR